MADTVDIHDFAERVERFCEFFLSKVERTGSDDLKVVEDLKQDAADLQSIEPDPAILRGLDSYMRGMPEGK